MNGTPRIELVRATCQSKACRARRAASLRAARAHRTAAGRRRLCNRDRRRDRLGFRSGAPSSPAGRSGLRSRQRAPAFRGREVAACRAQRLGTMAASVASSASTVSAQPFSRGRARARRARARVRHVKLRGDGGKNTKPDHVGAGIERGIEGFRRLQTADFDNNGHKAAPRQVLARRRGNVSPGTRSMHQSECGAETAPGDIGGAIGGAAARVRPRASAGRSRARNGRALSLRAGAPADAICPAGTRSRSRRSGRQS